MRVVSEITVFEIDDLTPSDAPPLILRNHRSRSMMVVIEVGGRTYTVSAQQLRAGIENATNAPT